MDKNARIALLEYRLNNLIANGRDNYGVQRRIRREIRNLKKEISQENRQVADGIGLTKPSDH